MDQLAYFLIFTVSFLSGYLYFKNRLLRKQIAEVASVFDRFITTFNHIADAIENEQGVDIHPYFKDITGGNKDA